MIFASLSCIIGVNESWELDNSAEGLPFLLKCRLFQQIWLGADTIGDISRDVHLFDAFFAQKQVFLICWRSKTRIWNHEASATKCIILENSDVFATGNCMYSWLLPKPSFFKGISFFEHIWMRFPNRTMIFSTEYSADLTAADSSRGFIEKSLFWSKNACGLRPGSLLENFRNLGQCFSKQKRILQIKMMILQNKIFFLKSVKSTFR